MRNAGVSKLMSRLYVLSMNLGQGRFGLAFWPMAKSKPEPEYSTLFIGPIAFVALSMTVLASCAKAVVVSSSTTARTHLRISLLRLNRYGNENTTTESVAIAATYCFPFFA